MIKLFQTDVNLSSSVQTSTEDSPDEDGFMLALLGTQLQDPPSNPDSEVKGYLEESIEDSKVCLKRPSNHDYHPTDYNYFQRLILFNG